MKIKNLVTIITLSSLLLLNTFADDSRLNVFRNNSKKIDRNLTKLAIKMSIPLVVVELLGQAFEDCPDIIMEVVREKDIDIDLDYVRETSMQIARELGEYRRTTLEQNKAEENVSLNALIAELTVRESKEFCLSYGIDLQNLTRKNYGSKCEGSTLNKLGIECILRAYDLLLINAKELLLFFQGIRTIPIIEVAGDIMPGWEKQIVELYHDDENESMPVVFRGAAKNWEVAAWTPDYFADRFGDMEISTFLPKSLESVDYDENNNLIAKVSTDTTFKDHINDITLNPKNSFYFFAPLKHNETKEDLVLKLDEELTKNSLFVHDYLDLATVTRFPQSFKSDSHERSYFLFIGSENTITALHTHGSTFLAQLHGKKIARLVHPKYIYKCDCTLKNNAFVSKCAMDIAAPDFEKNDRLQRGIEVHEVILEPGDVLYIPDGWLHDIRGFEGTSISVSSGF